MRIWLAVPMFILAACASAQPASEKNLAEKFASWYEPVPAIEVTPSVPATPLPLDLTKAANWEQAQGRLSEPARALLARNGFAVSDAFSNDRVEKFYDAVKNSGLPLFITSDSLLHLYHIQFDETLKGIEERQFIDQLRSFTEAMMWESRTQYFALEHEAPAKQRTPVQVRDMEAWRLCWAYFAVGQRLLAPDYWDAKAMVDQTPIEAQVAAEVVLIEAHAGFAPSPLFGYKEDYSQYVPRGHYTRSEPLKRYFKAMMWYGRMAFLIKGNNDTIKDALVSEETAKIQTLAALHIAELLQTVACKTTPEMKAKEIWERIYSVTAFYVGFADDLTPNEYRTAFAGLSGGEFRTSPALIDNRWGELQAALAKLRRPEIYSGTGNQAAGPNATEADLIKALANTQGMRLMGQRFIPDSYIMGRLVYPTVGVFNGRVAGALPFTAVQTPAGTIRGFPRGLDVIVALGSGLMLDSAPGTPPSVEVRARSILQSSGDSEYERYANEMEKLQVRFVKLAEKEWNRNLYWSWLYCLKGPEGVTQRGYPSFMRTSAWTDKQLNAFLGSWAQLRHDTILYAKQSNTMMATGMSMRPKPVQGYVEPVPELYRRLLALARLSRKGLDEMKALDDPSRARLTALEEIIERLYKISAGELANKKLSDDDYEFIRSFGDQLKGAVAGVSSEGLETTIIADVHTDANSGQVLEEGTGPMRGMAVAYPMPDGTLVIGLGPVFSYYEFKQPMSDRLTDEAWKALLRKSPPPLPEWTQSFATPPK